MKKTIVSIAILLSSSAFAQPYYTEVSYGGFKQELKINDSKPVGLTSAYPVSISCSNGKFNSLNENEKIPSFTTKQSVVQKSGYSEFSITGKLQKFDCDSGVSVKNFKKDFKVYDNENFTYIDPKNSLEISLHK